MATKYTWERRESERETESDAVLTHTTKNNLRAEFAVFVIYGGEKLQLFLSGSP